MYQTECLRLNAYSKAANKESKRECLTIEVV